MNIAVKSSAEKFMQTNSQLKTSRNFWIISSSRKTIMPFPGPYPTRWRLIIQTDEGRLLDYNGKPNPQLISKVERIAASAHRGDILLMEYDRGGAFRGCLKHTPHGPAFNLSAGNDTLKYAYYPFTPTGDFFGLWRSKVWLKRLVTRKGQVIYVYAPWEKHDAHITEIEAYFQWRRSLKLKKS